ncbi:MAG: cyclic lactone autoinducer peptide [Deltaproteobacteria bacterium]
MLTKVKGLMFTSLAMVFVFIAASNLNVCCPCIHYQPELPHRN